MSNNKFSYIGPKQNTTKFVGQNLLCTFYDKMNWNLFNCFEAATCEQTDATSTYLSPQISY
jgi:hypothetical protein